MLQFTKKEKEFLKKINTPAKIQDYLNSLQFNFEERGQTVKSPIRVLREKNAHCLEGAILAAYIFYLHGEKPLIMHLHTTKGDYDHVVALFKRGKLWGAISKTNHAVLRYRDPIYKNIRELSMSYFNEYFLDNGKKTLRSYSEPLNLKVFELGWWEEEKDLWGIDQELEKIKHFSFAPKETIRALRKADEIEIEAGKIVEYKKRKEKK